MAYNETVEKISEALVDVVEGMDADDLQHITGLPIERCEEIVKITSQVISGEL